MTTMKIAISVPDPVFAAGENLARQLGLSRSQLYSDALAAYLSTRGAEAVTARLNAMYDAESSKLNPAIESYQVNRLADETW
jgi:metal-responsive CopG/Arc/MetJ family transcriptional regulator